MADDPTASSSTPSRPKHNRSTTAGTVRGRSPSNPENGDGRPPTKRARKAINCEPCRNSKLKCDRSVYCRHILGVYSIDHFIQKSPMFLVCFAGYVLHIHTPHIFNSYVNPSFSLRHLRFVLPRRSRQRRKRCV
jgi:hypothetical protein